jgi:hypothetical protein
MPAEPHGAENNNNRVHDRFEPHDDDGEYNRSDAGERTDENGRYGSSNGASVEKNRSREHGEKTGADLGKSVGQDKVPGQETHEAADSECDAPVRKKLRGLGVGNEASAALLMKKELFRSATNLFLFEKKSLSTTLHPLSTRHRGSNSPYGHLGADVQQLHQHALFSKALGRLT